jgi:hypothetical protein
LAPTTHDTVAVFRRTFEVYGLPAVIRSDKGEPVAAHSLGRLSRLSVLVGSAGDSTRVD